MNQSLYLRPQGIDRLSSLDRPDIANKAWPLAGGPLAFAAYEVLRRAGAGSSDERQAIDTLLERLTSPRASFAGLDLSSPRIMGVINVTPDSFSDGGDRFDPGKAIDDGLAMREAGADLVDIGGESTRPGADPVPLDEELRRTIPVARSLAEQGVLVSIDTRRAAVMKAALDAGAGVVNDITALTGDEASLRLVAEAGAPVILMHMQGEPRTMQANPSYGDAPLDIYDFLADAVSRCEAAGIERSRIAVDPGIGFGKTARHNLELLHHLALFHGIGCPLLLGVSRKSFIGKLSRGEAPKDRLPGSLAAVLAGAQRGAQMFRVHDVAETVQALSLWEAIASAGRSSG